MTFFLIEVISVGVRDRSPYIAFHCQRNIIFSLSYVQSVNNLKTFVPDYHLNDPNICNTNPNFVRMRGYSFSFRLAEKIYFVIFKL